MLLRRFRALASRDRNEVALALVERAAESGDPVQLADTVAAVRQHLDSARLRFVDTSRPAA